MRDRKYIDRFQSGDFDAFGVLYDRYIDKIFAFIYRKTWEKELAEDLTSQVWMKALKSLEFFAEKENAGFKSWIYRIAQNTVIDHYRTAKTQLDLDSIYDEWISPNLAKYIDDKDTLQRVQQYLHHIKPIEREIVILRIWDDLSYKEIAEVCEKKEDSCKKIFSRALKKIQANILAILIICFLILM